MTKPHPKEIIQKIRREVLSGKSKYRVAVDMNLDPSVVYRHTSDIPSRRKGEPCIRGKAVDLLKQLLTEGYVHSSKETGSPLRKLKRHFPMIQRTQMEGKGIYYLGDKNKKALQSVIQQKKSRIINYHDLANISKIFDVNLSMNEKNTFLGKTKLSVRRKIRRSRRWYASVSKERQSKIDDFFGRFLHSEVLDLFAATFFAIIHRNSYML
jgi:hypothetical protein